MPTSAPALFRRRTGTAQPCERSNGGQRRGGGPVVHAWGVLADLIAEHAGAPGLVMGNPTLDTITQRAAHDIGVLDERLGGTRRASRPGPVTPAANPSGTASRRSDTGLEEPVDEAAVEIETGRVHLAAPAAKCAARQSRSGMLSCPAPSSARCLRASGGSGRRHVAVAAIHLTAYVKSGPRSIRPVRLRGLHPRSGMTKSRCPKQKHL